MNTVATIDSDQRHDINTVVVRGRITSEPRRRDLPSGSTVTQLEITTRAGDVTASVPVAVFEATTEYRADDEVVVLGYVRRRFFRAGGVTQSRTELVATKIAPTSRRRDVTRLVAAAVKQLETGA